MGAHGASQYNAEFMIAILSLYDNYGLISVNNSAKHIHTDEYRSSLDRQHAVIKFSTHFLFSFRY